MTKKLAIDWWIRQRHVRAIRQALAFGFADHCYRIVKQGLDANSERKLWPSSWTSYAMAAALPSDGNLKRKRRGETVTQSFECVGIASIVDQAPPLLSPPQTDAWLASAIQFLCPDVDAADAKLFATYSLRQWSRHRSRQFALAVRDRGLFVEFMVDDGELAQVAQDCGLDTKHAKRDLEAMQRQLERCL